MSVQYPPLRLLSAVMATKEEQLATRRRRGYWIKRARERQDLTLEAVAGSLGYSPKSISTISRWEDGTRPVPSDKLEPLARLLSLPAAWLINPPLTDEERLDAAVSAAADLEREDAARAEEGRRATEPVPVRELRRRSA
jgi:transcriptional regulator with XRE-family HTH domain